MRLLSAVVAALLFTGAATARPDARSDDVAVVEGSTVDAVVVASPLTVDVDRSGAVMPVGRRRWVRATVINQSTVPVSDLVLSLVVGEPFFLVDPTPVFLAELRPGTRRAVRWEVCADAEGGTVGLVRVEASLPEGADFDVASQGFVLAAEHAPGRTGCGLGR